MLIISFVRFNFAENKLCCGQTAIRVTFGSGVIYKTEPDTQAKLSYESVSFSHASTPTSFPGHILKWRKGKRPGTGCCLLQFHQSCPPEPLWDNP